VAVGLVFSTDSGGGHQPRATATVSLGLSVVELITMMWSHVIVVVSVTTAIVSSEHPLTLGLYNGETLGCSAEKFSTFLHKTLSCRRETARNASCH